MASFADGIREELLAVSVKRPCCKASLAAGLLLSAEREEGTVTARYRSLETADFAAEALRQRFGKRPEKRELAAYGRRTYVLSFFSAAAGKLMAGMENAVEPLPLGDCEGCRAAFLRGAFLACGTVNDPRKSTHMEFTPSSWALGALSRFLEECGYVPRISSRGSAQGLYFKDCASVEDLIALTGAGRAAMEMINVRIEREIRNQENRATNCVAKNIEKSVSAASRQMAGIEKLAVTGMLAQLSDGVRATALLRAENPDATLEELRNLHNPPITKSGLNHRLQKILEEADKI